MKSTSLPRPFGLRPSQYGALRKLGYLCSMNNHPRVFNGTEWLTLETAIETIGDMIAHTSSQLYSAQATGSEDKVRLLEAQLIELGKERQLCYSKNNNHGVITKILTQYAPKLRELNGLTSNR